MSESSIERAFSILDMFDEGRSTITHDEVVNELGFSRSTAYRYLQTLCSTGFLMMLRRGVYALGPRIVELERKIQLNDPLVNVGGPLMREWVDQYAGSALILCALWGERVLCLHQETSSRDGVPAPEIRRARGMPFPLFKGAASIALLAHQSAQKRRSIYLEHAAEIEASGLGGNWQEFRDYTREIRKQGYVVTSGSFGTDLVAISAPIRSENNDAIGSMTRILAKAGIAKIEPIIENTCRIAREFEARMLGDTTDEKLTGIGASPVNADTV